MTRIIIFSIFCLTIFCSTISMGQTKQNRPHYTTIEMGLSAIYNRSNKIMPKINTLLLFMNNIDSKNPPKSGLFYGIGLSGILNKGENYYCISTGIEYFNGYLEIDGKIHLSFLNEPFYFFEPQIGIFFRKNQSVLLLGYNFAINNKSPALSQIYQFGN